MTSVQTIEGRGTMPLSIGESKTRSVQTLEPEMERLQGREQTMREAETQMTSVMTLVDLGHVQFEAFMFDPTTGERDCKVVRLNSPASHAWLSSASHAPVDQHICDRFQVLSAPLGPCEERDMLQTITNGEMDTFRPSRHTMERFRKKQLAAFVYNLLAVKGK